MRTLIISLFILIVYTFLFCGQIRPKRDTEEKPDIQQSFPDIVDQIKKGIAYLEVGTNIDGIVKTGTAFLIHELGIFATCRHILFDTTTYEGKQMIPDTSRVCIKFHNYAKFYKAKFLTQRKDKDIVLIQVEIRQAELDSLDILPLIYGKSSEIRDGLDVACTGYDLRQKMDKFDKTYYWLTTHQGIISCVFSIGPEENKEYVDSFQADMLVNKGASGGPIYLVENGRFIGMFRGFKGREKEGISVNYGLASCIPSWAISNLFVNWLDSIKAATDIINVDTTTNHIPKKDQ